VGESRLVLVDPGPELPGQLDRLAELVAGRPVEAIALTHAHRDHSGIAAAAADRFAAPVAASAATLARLGMDGRPLGDDDTIPVDGGDRHLRAILTPGHSSDHTAFVLLPDRAVFTGDLVLGVGSSAVLHPDGEVGACLRSFSRVLSVRPGRLYPGHGPPVNDGVARLEEYRNHRLERHTEVTQAFHAGVDSVEELTRAVYGALPAELERAARASIRAHLVYMRAQGEEVPPLPGLDDTTAEPEEA
jgi:hydroxyacylglutathione hydrolase